MKKQVKKLSLNKKTISNLGSSEMSKMVGAGTGTANCTVECHGNSQKANTCPGHNTCAGYNTCG